MQFCKLDADFRLLWNYWLIKIIFFFPHRPNGNLFGYIDWTTGLLLSDNSSEVYSEQPQAQLHQPHLPPHPPPPPPLPPPSTQPSHHSKVEHHQQTLPPIVQLASTSTHSTPSYTIAPTAEIVTFAGSGGNHQPNLSASATYLPPFGEPSFGTDQRALNYCHRYTFSHQYQNTVPVAPPDITSSTLFSVPIPGPSHHSDSFPVMTGRAKSKGKDRLSNKRGTSVMS